MIIGIHGKKFRAGTKIVHEVFKQLEARKTKILVSSEFARILQQAKWSRTYPVYDAQALKEADFVFSMGGDGTFLETLTHVGKLQKPILGINTGRLGYLATTSKDNISETIDAVYNQAYEIDSRILLKLSGQKQLFDGINFALNDFTILKKDTSSMIVVHAYADGAYLNSYWADGLIVSTPTGSTGYSLSCGGPVVMPHSNNFVITPVAPHNLTTRPVVLPSTAKLNFEIEGRAKNVLITLDSRSRTVSTKTNLTIGRERFKAKLVRIKGYSNFDTLRQKLSWGLDVRNY